MTICPVCGKGELELVQVHHSIHTPVSHLACVERLAKQIERARSYGGVEVYACPLCTYEEGIFIESCQMHKDMHELETAMRQAEREAAFWKWLWEHEVDEYQQGNAGWFANRRKRFEKEGT
jgi:hypothetical protein